MVLIELKRTYAHQSGVAAQAGDVILVDQSQADELIAAGFAELAPAPVQSELPAPAEEPAAVEAAPAEEHHEETEVEEHHEPEHVAETPEHHEE